MRSNHGFVPRALFVLAILCTGLLICNLAAMPIHAQQVFVQRGRIDSLGETVILIGFPDTVCEICRGTVSAAGSPLCGAAISKLSRICCRDAAGRSAKVSYLRRR